MVVDYQTSPEAPPEARCFWGHLSAMGYIRRRRSAWSPTGGRRVTTCHRRRAGSVMSVRYGRCPASRTGSAFFRIPKRFVAQSLAGAVPRGVAPTSKRRPGRASLDFYMLPKGFSGGDPDALGPLPKGNDVGFSPDVHRALHHRPHEPNRPGLRGAGATSSISAMGACARSNQRTCLQSSLVAYASPEAMISPLPAARKRQRQPSAAR